MTTSPVTLDPVEDVDDPGCTCLDSYATARTVSRYGDGPTRPDDQEGDDGE